MEREVVTVSKFIVILMKIQEEHGDLPVWVSDSIYDECPLFSDEVEVLPLTVNEPKRVNI